MDIIYKSLEHAPSLVAMITVVVLFLKFLKELLDSHAKRMDETMTIVKDLNGQNIAARNEATRVIQENTRAAGMNTAAMNEMTAALRELARK